MHSPHLYNPRSVNRKFPPKIAFTKAGATVVGPRFSSTIRVRITIKDEGFNFGALVKFKNWVNVKISFYHATFDNPRDNTILLSKIIMNII